MEVESHLLFEQDYGGVGFLADSTEISIIFKPGADRMVMLPGLGSYERNLQTECNTTENDR